jgi:hypothetical protein
VVGLEQGPVEPGGALANGGDTIFACGLRRGGVSAEEDEALA